jgi:hypothetical protein
MTTPRARPRPAALALAVACALPGALALAPGLPLGADPAVDSRPGCATYAAGVSIEQATPLAALAAAPEDWAGETVRVEGEVREVCAMAGCWLAIAADGGGPPLRVKVEDGEIVFPLSARGQRAAAQGEVVVIESTREQHAAWLAHLAEERGEAFDPATVGDGPYRRIEVQATGAELCPDTA